MQLNHVQEHGVRENNPLRTVVEDDTLIQRFKNASDLIEPLLMNCAQDPSVGKTGYFDGCDAKIFVQDGADAAHSLLEFSIVPGDDSRNFLSVHRLIVRVRARPNGRARLHVPKLQVKGHARQKGSVKRRPGAGAPLHLPC